MSDEINFDQVEKSEKESLSKAGTATFLSISAFIIVIDQFSKTILNSRLDYGQPLQIFPGFDLLLVYNSGAAFSFLAEAGGSQRWLLAGISFVMSIIVFIWLLRLPKNQLLSAFALTLILGGAVGNLIDRVYLGYVIDFISVYYMEYRFATFNIADSAISVGAALLALDILKNKE